MNKTGEIISTFELRNCMREDFENFNATEIYDNLEKLDPINKTN